MEAFINWIMIIGVLLPFCVLLWFATIAVVFGTIKALKDMKDNQKGRE